jgi:SAM-dependent methyltransferase
MDFDRHERARWAGRAQAYETSFARLCAHTAAPLLDAATVESGDRVLDVGTGTGTVAALAAERGAWVVAVDAELTMLQLSASRRAVASRSVAPALGGPPMLLQAILPALPFRAAAFDATVANFVINHVGDPAAAVAELSRVTRPGGRVAVTVWPSPAPVAQSLWGEIFRSAGTALPLGLPRLEAANDFPRTEAGLTGLLAAAGLEDVRAETVEWVLRIEADDWWNGPAAGIATPGLILESQPAEAIPGIRAAFDEITAAYREPGGLLALPTAAVLCSGRAGTRGGPAAPHLPS